ncbi:MAG: hypothetical protein JW860_02680, partial [Sedimentisphaerales bacterium]|nr:hypothetical protein [Sedimentisphaerales bacterium]
MDSGQRREIIPSRQDTSANSGLIIDRRSANGVSGNETPGREKDEFKAEKTAIKLSLVIPVYYEKENL